MAVTAAVEHLVTRGLPAINATPTFRAPPELASVVPDQGFRCGSVVAFNGSGGTSLLLAAVAPAVQEGSWLAVVGMPTLGVEATAGYGVPLDRLVLVPEPGRRRAEVVAALIDSLDLVVVGATAGVRAGDARRLAARVRERRGLLFVVGPWPEPVDLHLEATNAAWSELELGDGTLRQREVTLTVTGRRAALRPRSNRLLLPAEDGRLRAAAPAEIPNLEAPLRALAG